MAESGLIQNVMVHSLRAFRDDPDLLLNTMDVFVKEPSLDWKVYRKANLRLILKHANRTNAYFNKIISVISQ